VAASQEGLSSMELVKRSVISWKWKIKGTRKRHKKEEMV
jgi:hypothetical protein